MVEQIKLFLVFFGFYVAFGSAAMDLFSTYLPDLLIYSGILVGFLGWLLASILSGQNFIFTSILWSLFFFILGKIGVKLKIWASGDCWYLVSTSALLAPAFPNFPSITKLLFFSTAFWVFLILIYLSLKAGFWKKMAPLLALALYFFATKKPIFAFLLFSLAVIAVIPDVEKASVSEKEVKRLEEEDLLCENLDLGFMPLKANTPLTAFDSAVCKRFGKGKAKVKIGYPLSPAFAIAYLALLANYATVKVHP